MAALFQEATLSGNVGAYERPLGPVQSYYAPRYEFGVEDEGYLALLGRPKKRKREKK